MVMRYRAGYGREERDRPRDKVMAFTRRVMPKGLQAKSTMLLYESKSE